MSGVKRTEDLHSLKTRSVVIQNADNTFPPAGSVLAAEDSRGHMVPTRALNLDSLIIRNNDLSIDASGNIKAHTITLDSTDFSVKAVADITVTGANITVSGDQNITGFVTAPVFSLLDPSSNDPNTYLFANGGSLLWQNNNLSTNINISQAVINQFIDVSSSALLRPQSSSDFTGMYNCLNALLTIFNSRQIFIGISGEQPGGGGGGYISNLPPYSAIFNSNCGMVMRFINSDGLPFAGIGDFIFYANPNNGSTQYLVANLCTNITNMTNVAGSALKDYLRFDFNTPQHPNAVTLSVLEVGVTYVIFLDLNRVGEAARLLNHLGFSGIKTTVPAGFGPPTDRPLIIPPPSPSGASQYIDNAITGSVTGYPFVNILKYPNNDPPLLSPTFTVSYAASIRILTVNVTANPNLTQLTPGNALQAGTGNALKYYGVYLNGKPIYLHDIGGAVPPITFTIFLDPSYYTLLSGTNEVAVSCVDLYNETVTPTVQNFSNS